jgi:uncharacterized repeat protein (TIGR03803 family)
MTGSQRDPKVSILKTSLMVVLAVAMTAMTLVAEHAPRAQTYTVLYSFDGFNKGYLPFSPVLRNSQGDVFGTTTGGGDQGFGLFFKLSSAGKETILHSFGRGDGAIPLGKVVGDATGNFYGTTLEGGTSLTGTIYKMDRTGVVTILYNFHERPGKFPGGGVIIDSRGNLYGTASAGGGAPCACGVVFEWSSTKRYTVLHRFTGGTDGRTPVSSLWRDSWGNLYGTTRNGGNSACTNGCGTVFKVSARGVEKIMHRFAGQPNDGANPNAGVVHDSAGNLYGTTSAGGSANQGTLFRIDATGKETILYSFQGGSDGAQPMAPLVIDSGGNLYGTTSAGGNVSSVCPSGCGTVFKLDSSGAETILHAFAGAPDGDRPEAGLIFGSDGNLYGTTANGGSANAGTVFKITP